MRGLAAALWTILWILAVSDQAVAAAAPADADTPIADQDELRYVPLQPSFVTNFGASDNGRLQFLRADVSVRVSGQAASAAARYHLPALRNALVLLLSRQDEGTVSTGAGREAIRAEALAELRAVLEAEEGQPYIDDVLFTNFIVQR
jgi:flagellar FliL protein